MARRWKRLHLAALVIWTLLIIPTVLLWSESILWIAFMSIYAILVSHFSAWRADSPNEPEEGDP